VFDLYSGETHYLNPLADSIYTQVTARGMIDIDALCAELTDAEHGVSAAEIGTIIARLKSIGLVKVNDDVT
jgi:PqqD family protein of HPr-rel-A system